LRAALASGELTVETDGDRVTYRSVSDLKSALAHFREEAAQARTPFAPTFGVTVAAFDRD